MLKEKIVSLVVVLGLICVSQGITAPPVIKEISSTGGHTQNKTGPHDRMYLVKPGDKIVFTVKAKGADKFVWLVNKQVQSGVNGNTFTLTIPRRAKGIWEIHVQAVGKDGVAHAEWVVSTLTKEEAPDIFEYFTDGRFTNRMETDPWGRTPIDWYTVADQSPPDPSRCYLQSASSGPTDDEGNVNSTIYTPSDIAYGTWIFKFLLPADHYDGRGGWTHLRFCFIDAEDPTIPPFWYVRSMDSHNYTGLGHVNRIDHDCGWSPVRKMWHEVKIIRTPDGGLFTWTDGTFQFRGRELRGKKCASLNIKLAHYRPDRNPEGVICCDMVEVYRNRYLFPRSIRYGEYIHDWAWKRWEPLEIERWFRFGSPTYFLVPPKPIAINLSRRTVKRWGNQMYLPVTKKGIVVEGTNIRLHDIANRIRNKKLFEYDRKTKTAICRTNLVISEGSELVLDGETLKFDCQKDGQYDFAVMFGATLRMNNSKITTTNDHYFNWRLASITHFGYHAGPLHCPIYTPWTTNLWYHGLCTLLIHNSTIDNFGYFFISSPMQVEITNTKFTNIHEVDTADYEHLWPRPGEFRTKALKNKFKGNKGFWLAMISIRTIGFDIRDLTFKGKHSPLNLTFMMNDVDYKNLNIYDIHAPKENIIVRKGMRIKGYARPSYVESTLGLVNAKFAKLIVPTDMARAVVKYYLKVDVTDATGKTIPGAKVKIINEVDNQNYPAEKDGNLWVLADYVQDKTSKKEFTYTVEVITPDGRKASLKGVNPDASWYRQEGKDKAMTVKVVVK